MSRVAFYLCFMNMLKTFHTAEKRNGNNEILYQRIDFLLLLYFTLSKNIIR